MSSLGVGVLKLYFIGGYFRRCAFELRAVVFFFFTRIASLRWGML